MPNRQDTNPDASGQGKHGFMLELFRKREAGGTLALQVFDRMRVRAADMGDCSENGGVRRIRSGEGDIAGYSGLWAPNLAHFGPPQARGGHGVSAVSRWPLGLG